MLKLSPGKNRIFYKAENFVEGLTVKGQIVLLDLSKTAFLPFLEVGNGTYVLEYVFEKIGRYVCMVFENGIIKGWKVIEIGY